MKTKDFYSHGGVFQGRDIPKKLLKDHTDQVTQKALNQMSPIAFGRDWKAFLEQVGLYHDLGKYTPFFQDYLLFNKKSKYKQHARFGAFALCQKFLDNGFDPSEVLFAFYIIMHHHADLSDFDGIRHLANGYGDCIEVFEKQLNSIRVDLDQIADEIGEPSLPAWLRFPNEEAFKEAFRAFYPKNCGIRDYFFINYHFSLLIEADKLDASLTEVYQRKSLDVDAVNARLAGSTNALRNKVRHDVVRRVDELDLEKTRLFTLTAPTGVGKTLTALDFALHLRDKVPSLQRGQIVYALPFINIIEQGLSEYQKVFEGRDCEILAHYQYADVFGQEKMNEDFDGGEHDYAQKVMSLDTWQSDIVITSFVQLLHTLIGSRNKLLKKFNHLADSILILDEVQTLRLDLLPVVGAAMFYLTKYLNTRVLLMTATKPEIMDLAYHQFLQHEGHTVDECEGVELLEDFEQIFSAYKRTKIIPLLNIDLSGDNGENTFFDEVFASHWQADKSCLIVVNKVNRSISLFDAVKAFLAKNGHDNPVYCLSTNIVPLHRLDRIQEIKDHLSHGRKPVLVATQVVEAGVDLNFDMGFRDLGPIDSIVQVAGRINREANPVEPSEPHKPLYVIDFKDCSRIYGADTYQQVKAAFSDKTEILESGYLNLVVDYFKVSSDKPFGKSQKVFEAMKKLRYSIIDEEFQIIEESKDSTSVFVLCDEDESKEVEEAFYKWQNKEMKKSEFDSRYKRDFHQRIIAVPKYYTEHLSNLSKDIKLAQITDYNLDTGFIRKAGEKIKDPTTFTI